LALSYFRRQLSVTPRQHGGGWLIGLVVSVGDGELTPRCSAIAQSFSDATSYRLLLMLRRLPRVCGSDGKSASSIYESIRQAESNRFSSPKSKLLFPIRYSLHYTVVQKTSNDNFNSSCPISVISGTSITE